MDPFAFALDTVMYPEVVGGGMKGRLERGGGGWEILPHPLLLPSDLRSTVPLPLAMPLPWGWYEPLAPATRMNELVFILFQKIGS